MHPLEIGGGQEPPRLLPLGRRFSRARTSRQGVTVAKGDQGHRAAPGRSPVWMRSACRAARRPAGFAYRFDVDLAA